jgi:hypothetical protein
MKVLSVVLLALSLQALALAQESTAPSTPPDVEIVSKNWRREVIHAKIDEDPFKANDQQRDIEREQKIATIYNETKAKNQKPIRPETPDSAQPTVEMPKDVKATYFYQAKIKNTGSKTIKSVDWMYLFLDTETKEEVSRFQTVSKVKINPGKSADLSMQVQTPPTNLIDATKATKDKTQFIEQVLISRIEYSDGSVWQRPQN